MTILITKPKVRNQSQCSKVKVDVPELEEGFYLDGTSVITQ